MSNKRTRKTNAKKVTLVSRVTHKVAKQEAPQFEDDHTTTVNEISLNGEGHERENAARTNAIE